MTDYQMIPWPGALRESQARQYAWGDEPGLGPALVTGNQVPYT
jgi:hypothetical protein